jgi:rhodanese-related sulfurtransferase
MRTIRTLAAGALLAALACSRGASGPPPEARAHEGVPAPGVVDALTGAALAASGAKVVDVRTPAEFAAGHVPGAVNIPFDEIARRAGELGGPETPVVLYCRSGRRSAIAADALRRLGYDKVWDAQRYDRWPRSVAAAPAARP